MDHEIMNEILTSSVKTLFALSSNSSRGAPALKMNGFMDHVDEEP